MRPRLLAIGLLWAALTAMAAAAPQGRELGTAGGKVIGPDGKAVEGARVTLQSSDGTHPETTQTNSQGQFWFPMLLRGQYDLRAYSNGRVSDWRKNILVEPGHQTTIILRLSAKKRL
jgi:hypothetical protein